MKLPLLFFFLLAGAFTSRAQTITPQTPAAVYNSGTLTAIVCFDSQVVSFTVTVLVNNVTAIEKNCIGCYCPEEVRKVIVQLKPGAQVIYSNIKRRTPNGGTTLLQSRRYIIR